MVLPDFSYGTYSIKYSYTLTGARDSRLLNAPEGDWFASLRKTVSALGKGWTNAAGFGIIRGESGFLSRLFLDK
jgi:hypothetical protein